MCKTFIFCKRILKPRFLLYLRCYFGEAEKKKKEKEPLRSLRSRFASRVHRNNLFKKITRCARSSRVLFFAKGSLAHARGPSACWPRESLPRDCLAIALSALGVKSAPPGLPPAGVPPSLSPASSPQAKRNFTRRHS